MARPSDSQGRGHAHIFLSTRIHLDGICLSSSSSRNCPPPKGDFATRWKFPLCSNLDEIKCHRLSEPDMDWSKGICGKKNTSWGSLVCIICLRANQLFLTRLGYSSVVELLPPCQMPWISFISRAGKKKRINTTKYDSKVYVEISRTPKRYLCLILTWHWDSFSSNVSPNTSTLTPFQENSAISGH